MEILRNSQHERFAQGVASGLSASEAYRQSDGKGKNADVHAARLMVNDGICKRVAELKEAQSQKSELSRDQLREFLTEVILTPAGKVDEQSRLCQSYKVTPEVREIRMPDKLRAIEQLAKLRGWNVPEKLEHGASDELTELLKRLRGGSPG
jgi:Terminase small subunit